MGNQLQLNHANVDRLSRAMRTTAIQFLVTHVPQVGWKEGGGGRGGGGGGKEEEKKEKKKKRKKKKKKKKKN